MRWPRLVTSLVLAVSFAASAGAQEQIIAFGDSITFGEGDSEGLGYPARLQSLLEERGINVTLENEGIPGETTVEGLARIDDVLAGGGDTILLMEGTNDVSQRVSVESIRFNLGEMASRSEAAGLETVHATILPRNQTQTDGDNATTRAVGVAVRRMAWQEERRLVDPFEVFYYRSGGYASIYSDPYHPDATGYQLLAEVFADVLSGEDTVGPVTGEVQPADGLEEVASDTQIRVELFDFGEGIDLGTTDLLVDEQLVDARISGSSQRAELQYTPEVPLDGIVEIGVQSRDLAIPANTLDRTVSTFTIVGYQLLDGDIDRDGRVDGADLVILGVSFGSRRGDGRYRQAADIDRSGVVDGSDLAILASNFGSSS